MSVRPDDRLVRRFRAVARALSCICLGILVLFGCLPAMKPPNWEEACAP